MTHTHILIQGMSFNLSTGQALFTKLNLALTKHKIGIVGKNGVGKSTLLKLIAGELHSSAGSIQINGNLFYVQQNPIICAQTTVAKILGYETKLKALYSIEQGSTDPDDFAILNDDWLILDKLQKLLIPFGLAHLSPETTLQTLSGGELTRLFLVQAFSSNADFILLDEPTNHLDIQARTALYHAIQTSTSGIIVASHDRALLNLMDEIVEISSLGVSSFGGNYDTYKTQKDSLTEARQSQFLEAKQSLEKAKRSVQLTKEKHEQRQSQGKALRARGDQPKMLLDAMANRSTAMQGSLTIRHNKMLNNANQKLHLAKEQLEMIEEIYVALPNTHVPNGKVILTVENLYFAYPGKNTLINNFNLYLQGAKRFALTGNNGSGKTTLIKLILSQANLLQDRLYPSDGKIYLGTERVSYLDQHASQLHAELSILENFMRLNVNATENEAYQALASFLFKNTAALKLVKHLSGGEKLRALLACTLLSQQPPQLLILDEPTNHLDIHSLKSIESALKNYQGAMIVVSHDQVFLAAIGVEAIFEL